MLFHPGIIALVAGSILVTLMTAYAALLGLIVLVRWDFQSSSAYQLSLERRTYLISTIMNVVLGFQLISLFLFIYTVDDIHKLFVGAMCATGSLNVNPVGWLALLVKIVVFFAAGFWIVLNYLDQGAEDYPLVKVKYGALLVLLPLVILDSTLQTRYFLGLDPEIITSCCGSLFSVSGGGVASSLAAFPVRPAMIIFYLTCAAMLLLSLLCLFRPKAFLLYLHTLLAAILFFVGLAGTISFISIYIYELPSHHCPFDIFQVHYGFVGYPLYLSLFGGVFFGMVPGLFHPLARIETLTARLRQLERRWLWIAAGAVSVFVLLTTFLVATSNLTYFSY